MSKIQTDTSKVMATAVIGLILQGCATNPEDPAANPEPTGMTKLLENQMNRSVEITMPRIPYEEALACVAAVKSEKMPGEVFTVGNIKDASGKYTFSDDGAGRYLPEDEALRNMAIRALRKAGFPVVNRNLDDVPLIRAESVLRGSRGTKSATSLISGSMSALEFAVQSDGFEARFNGYGVGHRDNTGIVSANLNYTDMDSSSILWSGEALGRFEGDVFELGATTFDVDDKLLVVDAGKKETPALSVITNAVLNKTLFNTLAGTIREDARLCMQFAFSDERFSPARLDELRREQQEEASSDQTSSLSPAYNKPWAPVNEDDHEKFPTFYREDLITVRGKEPVFEPGMPG